MPMCFVTISDPASYLAGWADVLDLDAKSPDVFDRFCQYVWNNGKRDFRGSWVYMSEEERISDIAEAAPPDDDQVIIGNREAYKRECEEQQEFFRAIPTIDELGRRFITEKLHDDPTDYGL